VNKREILDRWRKQQALSYGRGQKKRKSGASQRPEESAISTQRGGEMHLLPMGVSKKKQKRPAGSNRQDELIPSCIAKTKRDHSTSTGLQKENGNPPEKIQLQGKKGRSTTPSLFLGTTFKRGGGNTSMFEKKRGMSLP